MAGVLLSGPAGAGKSGRARALRRELGAAAVIADFTALFAALAGVERGPDGRYPDRGDGGGLLPLTELIRQTIIRRAVERELTVIATNSDGSPERRRYLLDLLGAGAREEVIDPGRDVVEARLSDAAGVLSPT